MNGALLVPLRPSPRLAALSLLLSMLLIGALIAAELPWTLRAPLLLLALAGGAHLLISHGLRRGPFAVTAVEWLGEGRWRLTDGRGTRREARRLAGGVVHHRLLALPFAAGRRRYSLLLLADAAQGESLRELRVRLLGE